MSTVAYEIVDVFTDRPFAGNPLAVVYGADELAGDQMQALAREFNLAETVFVLPPTTAGAATYRVRIFTPETELPFAGHPSVGAAVTSMRRGMFGPGRVVQECGAGRLPIEVTEAGRGTLTGGPPSLGPPLTAAPLLAALGLAALDLAALDPTALDPTALDPTALDPTALDPTALDPTALDPTALDLAGLDRPAEAGLGVPRSAGCGLDFVFVPVPREALAHARVDERAAERLGITGISLFAWDAERRTAYARVFCPGSAVPEDPATGSAALGLGVWLVAAGWLPADGTSTYQVHQGVEMKRPSLLDCTVVATAGVITSATVAGHVCPIARGEIAVPPFIG